MLIVTLVIVAIGAIFQRKANRFCLYRTQKPHEQYERLNNFKSHKKPDWVIHEVLTIKAQSPDLSCRLIAHVFNSRFAHKDVSVGKTFVNDTVRDNLYNIQVLRKKWKNRKPHKLTFNQYWGLDITFVQSQPVLGIIEHHSRKLVGLIPLSNKSSLNIIKQLTLLLRRFEKPEIIRTDNEACFNSKFIKLFLRCAGIKHQAIEKHCPWQNGRIERLFGTLKSNIKGMNLNANELPLFCYNFQNWYNAIRPHQSLKGKTPEEVYWHQVRKRDRH